MSLASSASNGKFPSSHSALMCDVIAKWLKSAPEKNGKIIWPDVAALFQLRLAELDDQNSFIYSDTDCHKHWKYLAYGESLVHDDLNLKAGRKHEDSDEVQHSLLHQSYDTLCLLWLSLSHYLSRFIRSCLTLPVKNLTCCPYRLFDRLGRCLPVSTPSTRENSTQENISSVGINPSSSFRFISRKSCKCR